MIDGIVLAAGFSRRMGLNKLLLPSKSGTVIEEALEKAKNTRLEGLNLVYIDTMNDYQRLMKEEAGI